MVVSDLRSFGIPGLIALPGKAARLLRHRSLRTIDALGFGLTRQVRRITIGSSGCADQPGVDHMEELMTAVEQTSSPDTFSKRLKEQTWPLHKMAEDRPLQRALTRGELPQASYAQYLGQLLLVHRALEHALREHRLNNDAIAAVFRDHQQREDDLRDDLTHLNTEIDAIEPLEPTRELVARIEKAAADTPIGLLGYLYVLEGSTNGSRFIARVVRKTYGFEQRGLSYFDPYGDEQPARWRAFKEALDAIDFSASDEQALFKASNEMFRSIAAVSDAVYEQGRTLKIESGH